jgi:hypothetical protein
MDEFNLHLTGDIHAITAANNLVARDYFIKFRSFRPLFLLVHSGRSRYRPWGGRRCDLSSSPRGVASQKSSET